FSAAKNEDQPIEFPSEDYTPINYGGVMYSKTAIVFDYLMAYLGEEAMTKAMQTYFDEWHFKHPMPEDLRNSLERSTGKNLSWLFDGLIKSTKKLDYKITFAHHNPDGSWDIGIKNTGNVNGPILIQGIKNGKLVGEVIYDGFFGKQALNFPASEIDYFKIDVREDMPEINRNNNKIKTHGLFKKTEPLKLQFLGSLDNPDKTQLFWTPIPAWNNYNKWMFGVALYNSIIPQKKFEFELMPLFSYSTKDIAGYAHVAYNIYPQKVFQRVTLGITTTRYAYSNDPFDLNFNKIAPELNIRLKKSSLRSPYNFDIRYRNITLIEDSYKAKFEFTPAIYSRDNIITNFNDLTLLFSKQNAIAPYDLGVNFQQGQKMMKAALTGHYSYNFKKKNKGIDIRVFAGTFVGTNVADAGLYRFRMSGQTGSQDYLYDNIFLGRTETEGVLSMQFTDTDGGFKAFSFAGQSSHWLAALNFKTSLGNLKLPIKLYGDIGTYEDGVSSTKKVMYDAGLCLSFRKDVFEIYFPLVLSQEFKDYQKIYGGNYGETIRFTLNLNLVNPFSLIRNFSM
ncbi:MAG: hypothetical protein H0X46_07110, partial [Bacteroidetes bacterium]|nr:hypothetical protein [Bacteroidota bacterium]